MPQVTYSKPEIDLKVASRADAATAADVATVGEDAARHGAAPAASAAVNTAAFVAAKNAAIAAGHNIVIYRGGIHNVNRLGPANFFTTALRLFGLGYDSTVDVAGGQNLPNGPTAILQSAAGDTVLETDVQNGLELSNLQVYGRYADAAGTGHGIFLNTIGGGMSDLHMSNVFVRHCSGGGIMQTGGPLWWSTFRDIKIDHVKQHGFNIDDLGTGAYVQNFIACRYGDNFWGIRFAGSSGSWLSGNTLACQSVGNQKGFCFGNLIHIELDNLTCEPCGVICCQFGESTASAYPSGSIRNFFLVDEGGFAGKTAIRFMGLAGTGHWPLRLSGLFFDPSVDIGWTLGAAMTMAAGSLVPNLLVESPFLMGHASTLVDYQIAVEDSGGLLIPTNTHSVKRIDGDSSGRNIVPYYNRIEGKQIFGSFEGNLKVPTNTWQTSSDTKERLYFGTNGGTIIKSGVNTGVLHSWRSADDVDRLSLSATGGGTLTCANFSGNLSGSWVPPTDTWLTSADTKERFYYASNAQTYFKAGADTGTLFYWREQNNADLMTLDVSRLLSRISGLQMTNAAGTNSAKLTSPNDDLVFMVAGTAAQLRQSPFLNDIYFDDSANGNFNFRSNTAGSPVTLLTLSSSAATAPAFSTAGAVTIGSGAPITKVLSVLATVDLGLAAGYDHADATVTVTGAATGDLVVVTASSTVMASTIGGTLYGWVSAANTVTIRHANTGDGNAVDLPSGSYRVTVFKF